MQINANFWVSKLHEIHRIVTDWVGVSLVMGVDETYFQSEHLGFCSSRVSAVNMRFEGRCSQRVVWNVTCLTEFFSFFLEFN